VKRWKWLLLIFELALFATILVLPQVALPDLAVHGGSSPIVVKAQASSVPAQAIVASVPAPAEPPVMPSVLAESYDAASPDAAQIRLSLLCTLLC
jgi:hypothetical protein